VKVAAELIMLSETLSAARAREIGIVNRVVAADQLEAEVATLATKLAAGPTQAFAQTKRLLNQTFETPMRAHLDDEIRRFAACAATEDFKEGVTAFVEKRKPVFKG
ncbi:MAG: enoyl-CoA hydratase-related protein, partial [Burkholderiales bacterium]